MKTWKVWIIASHDHSGVSSQVVDFDTEAAAEAAIHAVNAADEVEGTAGTYTQVEALRLYEAPLQPGWDKM